MTDPQPDKKIIIDEDWKHQVEAEKEALKKEKEQRAAQPHPEPHASHAARMPEASFAMLISTLATEAMIGLGQVPHPATGKPAYEPEQAKYFIDTLHVIQEKTKGNLTPDESQALEDMLHQLRMAYVALSNP